MRQLLMGNEAIARGALEAGLDLAAAYPGTPSSEILSTLAAHAKEYGFHAEWSVNEKVALEVAAGAAFAGSRCLVAMKQVGLNVAADPLMSLAYLGVAGALVIVVADDPGPHSSQTEQDTRRYGALSKLPVLDPASPAEAKAMTMEAFDLSARLGIPVIVRPTTRVCHGCGPVEIGPVPERKTPRGFERDNPRVCLPSHAAQKHIWLENQVDRIREEYSRSEWNTLEGGQGGLGIVTGGVSYLYVLEALSALHLGAAVLKVGVPHPFPLPLAGSFLDRVDRVLVVEEEDPVLEEGILLAAAGLTGACQPGGVRAKTQAPPVFGKFTGHLPRTGEYGPDLVRGAIAQIAGLPTEAAPTASACTPPPELPQRPPTLCAGCPHRSVFYAVKKAARKLDPVYSGDIGCYTLGAAAPLKTIDTCVCMGGAVTVADGLALAETGRPHISFIGDSTFFHMGITGLINAVYNRVKMTLVILDNRTTAMTGHQPHPGLGRLATGEESAAVDPAGLARACGVGFVREVDSYDLGAIGSAVREALASEGPSVIVARRACAVLARPSKRYKVSGDCTGCLLCLREIGCPALASADKPYITSACAGCGLCAEICPNGAIVEVED